MNFFDVTYSEPFTDLSGQSTDNLLSGYAGLLAKEVNADGTPKYSKAPSMEKNKVLQSKTNNGLHSVLEGLLFEFNEFFPADLKESN